MFFCTIQRDILRRRVEAVQDHKKFMIFLKSILERRLASKRARKRPHVMLISVGHMSCYVLHDEKKLKASPFNMNRSVVEKLIDGFLQLI